MKKNTYILIIIFFSSIGVKAQLPVPDAYYDFNANWFIDENKTDKSTATTLPASVGRDAVWYNYNEQFPAPFGGFKDAGKFGSSAYFSGYKSNCGEGNGPSSARDILIFAGNGHMRDFIPGKNWDVVDTSAIWQGVRKSMTVAYWWKSDRPFSGTIGNACAETNEVPGWEEDEFHFDGGAFNGIEIRSQYGLFKLGWRNGSKGKDRAQKSKYWFKPAIGEIPGFGDWVHVAVTFDGATGELTLYLNGVVAIDADDDPDFNPNPLVIGNDSTKVAYSQFDAVDFTGERGGSCVFGGQNGYGVGGNGVSSFWGTGDGPDHPDVLGWAEDKYRTGWPARGYLDEFAYWKNVALPADQIKEIMDNEISSLLTSVHDLKYESDLFLLSPNPSDGMFVLQLKNNISDQGQLIIWNLLGEKIFEQKIAIGTSEIVVDQPINKGMYLVELSTNTVIKVDKLLISK